MVSNSAFFDLLHLLVPRCAHRARSGRQRLPSPKSEGWPASRMAGLIWPFTRRGRRGRVSRLDCTSLSRCLTLHSNILGSPDLNAARAREGVFRPGVRACSLLSFFLPRRLRFVLVQVHTLSTASDPFPSPTPRRQLNMRSASLAVALSLAALSVSAQPLVEAQDGKLSIPLVKRGVNELTKPDGTVAWDRVQVRGRLRARAEGRRYTDLLSYLAGTHGACTGKVCQGSRRVPAQHW